MPVIGEAHDDIALIDGPDILHGQAKLVVKQVRVIHVWLDLTILCMFARQ